MSESAAEVDETLRKPRTPLRRARFWLEWLGLWWTAFVLRCLPRSFALFIGRIVGNVAWLFSGESRDVARQNLDLALGDTLDNRQKRRLIRWVFARFGQIAAGLLWAPRLTPQLAADRMDTRALCEQLEILREQKRGVVLVTGHYNDWELICLALGHAGYPLLMVTEPMPNPRVARIFDACRSSSGNRLIPPKFATLKLFRALRGGERIALMADVNGRRGRGGVWVPFFGVPVFNATAMAELARRTNAAIGFCVIHARGRDMYEAELTPLIEPDLSADPDGEVFRLTQIVTSRLEHAIKAAPEPWLWTYKRWKRRPTPENEAYPAYSSFKRVM